MSKKKSKSPKTKSVQSFLKMISEEDLLQYAGPAYFSRGEEYFEDGRVADLRFDDAGVRAKVLGTSAYRVKLWEEDGVLAFSCSCPLFEREEEFCKHCVAVGLACLEAGLDESTTAEKEGRSGERMLTTRDVESFLEAQDKATLVSLLLNHAKDDDRLHEMLLMKAAKSSKKVNLPTFRRSIDEAVGWEGFVDYKSMYEYSRGIDDVISSIKELLTDGHAGEVIDLSEYFLRQIEGQSGMMDDSDGYMGGVLQELQELHHTACVKAKPEPVELAKKLFKWELQSEWEVFYGAPETYADVLGKSGLAMYRSLAEAEWEQIPPIRPGQKDERYARNRFRITHIMETLASQTGDIEALVAIKSKDLSSAYSYLKIAELYKRAGKKNKALEWAEDGLKAFPNKTDSRLREFLANEHHARARHDDAMKLIWQEFSENATLESYKLLKKHARMSDGSSEWKRWREMALQWIRDDIARRKEHAGKAGWHWNLGDHSELVRVFLWEKDVEQAWQEAQSGGCNESLWLELARLREEDHPEDAAAVYQSLVEPTVNQKHNEAYREAAEMLGKIKRLLKRMGREEEWMIYYQTLRAAHLRKRNFIALLEKLA